MGDHPRGPFDLTGQLALVTGGGTGLGFGMSRALVEAGARVVITGRRLEVLRRACEQLGERSAYIRHDVTDLPSIPPLVEEVEARFGPIDILINHAGNHLKKPALETTDEEFEAVIRTHVYGSFALSREVGRRMVARRRGCIIMVASMNSLIGMPQVVAYTAAKSALPGLVRSLTVEFAPYGVRVNAIAPGWIESDMLRSALKADPERERKILSRTPMGRFGQPEDIGYAAVYLASPAARFVTGVVLPVDGGASIGF